MKLREENLYGLRDGVSYLYVSKAVTDERNGKVTYELNITKDKDFALSQTQDEFIIEIQSRILYTEWEEIEVVQKKKVRVVKNQ